MIDYLDSFVDTKRKRRLFIKTLCWLGWLIWCGCALYTALRLLSLSDYASLFSLLNDPSMELFPISRMVLSMMSLAQGSALDYVVAAMRTLHIWEWCLLGICLFLLHYSRRARLYLLWMLGMGLYVLGCGLLFLRALSAVSLQTVVDSVWLIGVISAFWFALVSGFVLFRLWRVLRAYRKAMAYYVKEVVVEDVPFRQEEDR